MLTIHNLTDGDTVHQRCLLLVGQSDAPNAEATDRVALSTTDNFGRSTFPIQQWPMCHGHFKVLVVLSPGTNRIIISHNPRVATVGSPAVVVHIVINYVPLLQVPPLHLAILVAKDSPLQIDCPPAKHGALSSAHSSLEAAISKFRMTAYMWQALTAEDMRRKGLGRRSFRLEEEWGFDSLSSEFLNIKNDGAAFDDAMRSTAKVHLVRTERTVAELRDLQRAQQNPHGRQRDELHDIFSKALKASGGVFESAAKPVVAGLILDAHFSADHDMILAHAALGAHNANGLSLGVMGSHLTYAWPRFLEEVPDCLLDTTAPGEMVGNDNKECESIWEACAVGQGAFLHETGHAFSAPHTSGIMARGYSQHWPKCFLAQTAYCVAKKTEAITPVTEDTANECTWDVRDALRFKNLPHFRLPSDMPVEPKANSAVPEVQLLDDEDFLRVQITSQSGLAGVWLNGKPQPNASIKNPVESLRYTLDELEERFDRTKPLELELLAMNGKCRTCNMWRLFTDKSTVRVPGTSIRLQKASVGSQEGGEPGSTKNEWSWAVMLKKRTKSGKRKFHHSEGRHGQYLARRTDSIVSSHSSEQDRSARRLSPGRCGGPLQGRQHHAMRSSLGLQRQRISHGWPPSAEDRLATRWRDHESTSRAGWKLGRCPRRPEDASLHWEGYGSIKFAVRTGSEVAA